MRMPRLRFTVRGMMVAVAVVALMIGAYLYRLPEPAAAMRAAELDAVKRQVKRQGWYLVPGTGQLKAGQYEPSAAIRRSPTDWEVRFERVSGEGPPMIATIVRQWQVDAAKVWWRPMRYASQPKWGEAEAAIYKTRAEERARKAAMHLRRPDPPEPE